MGTECPLTAALRVLDVPEPYPSKKTCKSTEESRVKLLRTRLAQGVDEALMDAVLAAVRPLVKPNTTDGDTVCVVGFATEEPPRENLHFCDDEALKATVGSGFIDWNELHGDMNEEALIKFLNKAPFKGHVTPTKPMKKDGSEFKMVGYFDYPTKEEVEACIVEVNGLTCRSVVTQLTMQGPTAQAASPRPRKPGRRAPKTPTA